jgi:hypothetical protein
VIFSLVSVCILRDVRSCLLMQEAATFNVFYDGLSFQHLATVFISVFTLCYGPGLLFRGPSCIKCGVSSSLLTYFWLLQKVCGTLDYSFITTHSVQNGGDLLIYSGVIFHKTRHHAQAHVTAGAPIYSALLPGARLTQTAAEFGG